jgi:hypothetical protein
MAELLTGIDNVSSRPVHRIAPDRLIRCKRKGRVLAATPTNPPKGGNVMCGLRKPWPRLRVSATMRRMTMPPAQCAGSC